MKKLVIIIMVAFSLFFVAEKVNAQAGVVKTLALDTLKGNNDNDLGIIYVNGTYKSLAIQVLANKISAAAGGSIHLRAGLDAASIKGLNDVVTPDINFITNDTFTVTDGGYWLVEIPNPGFDEYHIYGDGDVNDTVKITTKYLLKE